MPLDASIYNQVGRPNVELESPQNALMRQAQLQGAQNQNRLAGMHLQDAADERTSRNALASAYQSAVGADGQIDRTKLYTGIAQSGQGAKLPGIQKQLTEADTAQLTAHKAKIDQGLQELEIATRIGGSIKDQNSLDAARALVTKQFGPEAAAKMPTVYDPAEIARNLQLAMSTKDQLAQKQLEIDNKLKADKFAYDQKNDAANRGIAAGNLGVARDRLKFDKEQPKGQYDSATGMLVDTRNGTARPVTGPDGQPISSGGKPLTDTQAKALQFGSRMQNAGEIIDTLANAGVKVSVPGSRAGFGIGSGVNALQPEDRQRLDQAKRDFINAVLRRESGAAISPSEFDSAEKQYFPQVGEGKAAIEQKRQAREISMRGILAEVPNADTRVAKVLNKSGSSKGKPSLDDIFK